MTRMTCDREQDVLDAIGSRRWPDACEGELRRHVASCAVCADLAVVANALLDSEAVASEVPVLPPAALVWWRAQLHAREDAARRAVRPIRIAQVAGVVCVGVFAAVLAGMMPFPGVWLSDPASRIAAAFPQVDGRAATEVAAAVLANRSVQLAVAAWLVLAPVAAYLALARD